MDVAAAGFGLDVDDVAVVVGDRRHRLTGVLAAIGGGALCVEGVRVGVDRQLDGERQCPHEAGAGLDVGDAQATVGALDEQIEGAGDLVGVVDDDAFHHGGVDGEAVGGECGVDRFDVGGVRGRRDVVGVRPGLLEHGVDCGAEVSADGGAAGLGGAFADIVEGALVAVGGGDQCEQVCALGEAEGDHALGPADEPGAVVKGFGDGGGACVAGELAAGRRQHQVAAPSISAGRDGRWREGHGVVLRSCVAGSLVGVMPSRSRSVRSSSGVSPPQIP